MKKGLFRFRIALYVLAIAASMAYFVTYIRDAFIPAPQPENALPRFTLYPTKLAMYEAVAVGALKFLLATVCAVVIVILVKKVLLSIIHFK